MTTADETLMDSLRNAHAMEKQAIESTEKQIDRLEHYPEMRAWVRDHVESSRRQREQIGACLERRGGDASSLKDMALSFMGNVQDLTGTLAADEVVKNAITDYGFKHYEIGAYECLRAAAQTAGDAETVSVVDGIIREEQALADRLRPILPQVMTAYMHNESAGAGAKR